MFAGAEDLCKLLVAAYEKKYSGVAFSPRHSDPFEDISRLRLDLFSRKANEQATIPLASTIKLQFQRSAAILNYWTGCLPKVTSAKEYFCSTGWKINIKTGERKIKLL